MNKLKVGNTVKSNSLKLVGLLESGSEDFDIPAGWRLWDCEHERGDCLYGIYALLPESVDEATLDAMSQRPDFKALGGFALAKYFRASEDEDDEDGFTGNFLDGVKQLSFLTRNPEVAARFKEILAAIESGVDIERDVNIRVG